MLDRVIKAKKVIKEQVAKKGKLKGKGIIWEAKIEEDNREEDIDKSESKVEDCIIVDIN